MVVHGKKLIITVGGSAIAGAKSCEINIQCDDLEVASATQGKWREFLAGRKDWSVTCGHLLPASGTPLKSSAAMVGTKVVLSIQTDMTGDILTGSAIVKSWRASGAVDNLATGAFSFRGSGALV
jgi:predicted secreted protein